MTSLLKKLKTNFTWVRIFTKSKKGYCGNVKSFDTEYIKLNFFYTGDSKKKGMTLLVKQSEIESIEYLDCKNSQCWTKLF